ncbi:MAG: hypothetical protein ACFFG0_46130 [Candidatus Thorarchaeota archaeon]
MKILFEFLIDNAPADNKKLLSDNCGEIDVGYEIEKKQFYFLMFDLEEKDEEEPKLIAITIDINEKLNLIKDFKME